MATEYEAGLNQAKKENKPLVLYLNTKNCYYCVAMEKTTLADKEIEAGETVPIEEVMEEFGVEAT